MQQLSLPGICWILLILLQPVWHAVLPAPLGNRNWPLALVATLPLLLPLRGIIVGSTRSWTWGGYLALLYFSVGIMEAWSNPAQRAPAMAQIVLAVAFIIVVFRDSRPQTGP